MISLKDLRNKIKNLTNHYPSTQPYNTELDEIINEAQNEIWNLHQWSFAIREAELPIRPDITAEEEDLTIGVNRGGREVSFSSELRKLGYLFYGNTWEGQVIEINGRDYPILTLIDEEHLLLAQPYQGTTETACADWKIKHPYYRLPQDCLKLLQWVQTDKPIPGNTHQYAPNVPILNQSRHYPHTQTAEQATCIFRMPDLQIPAGEKISVSWATAGADPTAIPQNRWYEFAWSFKYAGRYGPLSESIITQATGATWLVGTITCKDMLGHNINPPTRINELDVPYPVRWEGMNKVLWYNANVNPDATAEKSVRLGPPCWRPVLDFDPNADQFEHKQLEINYGDPTFTLAYEDCMLGNSTSNLTMPIAGDIITPNRWTPHNIQQVRPYPRINSTDVSYEFGTNSGTVFTAEEYKRIIIRYLARPEQMILATDGMSLPDDAVNCLVYKALENVFNKHKDPGMADHYATKFKNEIKTMERNHLSSVEDGITRGRWSYGNRNSRTWDPYGPVTVQDL